MTPHNARQSEQARLRRDALAELVANGMTIARAGLTLGVSETTAMKMWMRIKQDMGSQAR